MKITKLNINNFKSIEYLEVKENKNEFNKVNLLIGSNASGKSNFIQIFEFLKAIKQLGFQNKEFKKKYNINNLKNFNTNKNIVSIEIELKYDEKIFIREIDNENSVYKIREKILYQISLFIKPSKDFDINEKVTFYEYYIKQNKDTNEIINLSSILVYGIENNFGKFSLTSNQDRIEKYYNPKEIDLQVTSPYPPHYLETLTQGFKNQTLLKFSGLLIPDDFFEFGVFDIKPYEAKQSYPDMFVEELEKDASNLTPLINQILKNEDEISEQFKADISGTLNFIEDIKIENFNEQLTLKAKEI